MLRVGRRAYSDLLLFKMLIVGIWNGGLIDESVEEMAHSNLHVMRVSFKCVGFADVRRRIIA